MAKVALVIPPFFWTKTPHVGKLSSEYPYNTDT